MGLLYNIVCGKESRRSKPRSSKAHNALFCGSVPRLPVSYSVDRGHFAHPARAAETEQENHSRCQNRAGNVYKSVIAAVYYNRLRGIIYKHFPEWVAEYQTECCADNGNSEVFCKVQPRIFMFRMPIAFITPISRNSSERVKAMVNRSTAKDMMIRIRLTARIRPKIIMLKI